MVVIMPCNQNPDALCYSPDIEEVGSRVCVYTDVSENGRKRENESYGKCNYFSCHSDKIDLSYMGLIELYLRQRCN